MRSSPVVADGVVYCCSGDNFIYVLDAKEGSLHWKHKAPSHLSDPVVLNETVYFCSDEHLYAFHTKSGSLKWKYKTGKFVETTPVIFDGVVYAGSNDKCVYAIKIR